MNQRHFFHKLFCFSALVSVIAINSCKKETTTFGRTESPTDFLSSKNCDKLTVEVQYMSGCAPDPATLNTVLAFLQSRLNKGAGINIIQERISAQGKASYSLQDLQNIENTSRTQKNSGATAVAYFLFVDGDYALNSGNSKVLGITYSGSSVAVFENSIKSLSGGLGQPQVTVLESTVSEHEWGHLMGLVNDGTGMLVNHQDAANGKHCGNTSCLMYYSVETSNVVGNLLGGNIPPLDAECLNDLRANGGK
jgi:hypothetical protein